MSWVVDRIGFLWTAGRHRIGFDRLSLFGLFAMQIVPAHQSFAAFTPLSGDQLPQLAKCIVGRCGQQDTLRRGLAGDLLVERPPDKHLRSRKLSFTSPNTT